MQSLKKPEVLAPAGSRESLAAALAAGADAIYFGLDEGFNARARASNFPIEGLADTVEEIHRGGARAYLTLNTLIFQSELAPLERILRAVVEAGVDALIVQDPAVALLARRLSPGLEIHASTQMTISSPEAARFAETLGITRVVLPRELSLEEIAAFRKHSSMETEVFIAGALCVSWSGQCLSSETWGGRSANRGQCAQACRLPYDLSVDGEIRPLGEIAYLLSPQDLAGYRAVSSLMELGVHTLKIEGRQKDSSYVYNATQAVQHWIGAALGENTTQELQDDFHALSMSYSRGFGDGFFDGGNHQTLVDGRAPRHRGLPLGRVAEINGRQMLVEKMPPPGKTMGDARSPLPTPPLPANPIQPQPGMGLVVQNLSQEDEVGGPIYGVVPVARGWWLDMGARGPSLSRVKPGSRVFVTSDPQVDRKVRQALAQPIPGRVSLHFRVSGKLDAPLSVEVSGPHGLRASVVSEAVLGAAQKKPIDEALVRDKLGSLGGTSYTVESVDLSGLDEGLFMPVSLLKDLRRDLVEQLEAQWERTVTLPAEPVWPQLQHELTRSENLPASAVRLAPLVRTDAQLEAVIEAGLPEVTLDWMELVGLRKAFLRAREAGLRVGVATVRVQKPLEEGYDRRLAALEPDHVLLRHWAGVMELTDVTAHGDFSLNVTNAITAHHLLNLGLQTVTAAHDLDHTQLVHLLDAFPGERLAVTLHHHIPTFHTEHCVYSHLLSEGRDYRTCGRPCEHHKVGLSDRKGITHPVVVDVGCRNTIFNGKAQSAARLLPDLIERGVRLLRVEFVWEDKAQTLEVLNTYRDLLAGRCNPSEALIRIGALEQFGVGLGTMQVIS